MSDNEQRRSMDDVLSSLRRIMGSGQGSAHVPGKLTGGTADEDPAAEAPLTLTEAEEEPLTLTDEPDEVLTLTDEADVATAETAAWPGPAAAAESEPLELDDEQDYEFVTPDEAAADRRADEAPGADDTGDTTAAAGDEAARQPADDAQADAAGEPQEPDAAVDAQAAPADEAPAEPEAAATEEPRPLTPPDWSDEGDEPGAAAAIPATPTPPAAEPSAEGAGLDAGALDALIRRVIREELVDGQIGQNISLNVQRLIREEVARILERRGL